jgi:two-component system phosphate regulon sensor histidine kinase PhoR
MNKKITLIISIISSISLVGIVIVQLLWVNYALDLRSEIFDKRVQLILKDVAEQLTPNSNLIHDSIYKNCINSHDDSSFCIKHFKQIHRLDVNKLDSLMYDIFCQMRVNEDYVYGIIDKKNNRLISCSNNFYETELLNTYHTYPIPCYKSFKNGEAKYLGVYFPYQNKYILNRMMLLLIMSSLFVIIVIVSFITSIKILLRQKRISEMKTDFVNNMTHEFKTPIATISLASEMLTNPSVQDSRQKIAKYANIIYDENNRLKSQVEQVLQISVLDKRDFKLMKKEFNIHEIIENAVENYQLVVEQRNGKMILDLKAEPSHIFADPVHFYNIISNLIDNAIKYSEKAPIIKISTSSLSNGVSISIEDNGIGISPENIKLVFKKLYRIPTGNLHDAKGFGLGLYYVKTMVEAHGGKIKLRSELKKGSTFELFFPFNHNSNIH